jgi:hypothetical protein
MQDHEPRAVRGQGDARPRRAGDLPDEGPEVQAHGPVPGRHRAAAAVEDGQEPAVGEPVGASPRVERQRRAQRALGGLLEQRPHRQRGRAGERSRVGREHPPELPGHVDVVVRTSTS